ncbi:MAG: SPFH domain-containing protein [Gemmatimonadaceae bacterium]
MGLGSFFRKQFIDVIHWTEPEGGVLAYRYPMQDMEIQNGAVLTVREGQAAAFVNEGRLADVFGPGRYTLSTETLPLLTNLMHWDKAFQSPFKSDVYFFSTRLQLAQRWGTAQPVTIRDQDFGAVRLRAFGTYAYRLADPALFHTKVSGTRDVFTVADLEPQVRNLVVSRMVDSFAESQVPFLDMAANQMELGQVIADHLKPGFVDLGLVLETFTVESLSLPDELQKRLDERIGMSMIGDLDKYTKFQVGQSIPLAAQNEGGAAGLGAGLGAGMAMGQAMANAMNPAARPAEGRGPAAEGGASAPSTETKFCAECGAKIPRAAKFCSECGAKQG